MTTRLSFSYPVTSHKASAFFPFLTVSVLIFLSAPPKCFSGFISLKKKKVLQFWDLCLFVVANPSITNKWTLKTSVVGEVQKP